MNLFRIRSTLLRTSLEFRDSDLTILSLLAGPATDRSEVSYEAGGFAVDRRGARGYNFAILDPFDVAQDGFTMCDLGIVISYG